MLPHLVLYKQGIGHEGTVFGHRVRTIHPTHPDLSHAKATRLPQQVQRSARPDSGNFCGNCSKLRWESKSFTRWCCSDSPKTARRFPAPTERVSSLKAWNGNTKSDENFKQWLSIVLVSGTWLNRMLGNLPPPVLYIGEFHIDCPHCAPYHK